MDIILLQADRAAREATAAAVRQAKPDARLYGFSTPAEALDSPDILHCAAALVEVHPLHEDIIELVRRLKQHNPDIGLVYLHSRPCYTELAQAGRPTGYLQTPVTAEAVRRELASLPHPSERPHAPQLPSQFTIPDSRLHIRCFGEFEVFSGTKPIYFPREGSKELFAYLIYQRGRHCPMHELGSILCPGEPPSHKVQTNTRTMQSGLMRALACAHAAQLVMRDGPSLYVNTGMLDCDYFRFLQGDPAAGNSYSGEFMTQYPWAAFDSVYFDFGRERYQAGVAGLL